MKRIHEALLLEKQVYQFARDHGYDALVEQRAPILESMRKQAKQ